MTWRTEQDLEAAIHNLKEAWAQGSLSHLEWDNITAIEAAIGDYLQTRREPLGPLRKGGEFAGLPERVVNPLRRRGYETKEQVRAMLKDRPDEWWCGFRGLGPKLGAMVEEWAA